MNSKQKIRNRLRFIVSKLRYNSFPRLVLDTLKIIKIRINPFYILREGLHAGADSQSRAPDGCEIRVIHHGDLPQFVDFPDRTDSLESLQERMDRGDIGLGAWLSGTVAGFTWARTDEFLSYLYRFDLRADEAYLYDAYISIPCRGSGLAGHLRYRLYETLAERGRHTLFSVSDRFNRPSLRFKEKLGARIVDFCCHASFFRRWQICTAARPEKLRRRLPR